MPISTEAFLGGEKISEITNVFFNGSSGTTETQLPRCIGSLVRPSGDSQRIIQLECRWFFDSTTKADLELLQLALGSTLAKHPRADLVIHGNTYKDVVPVSCTFEQIIHDRYISYNINFELDYKSRFLNSQIRKHTNGRFATFEYNSGTGNIDREKFIFEFMHNVDLTYNTNFGIRKEPRDNTGEGSRSNLNGGIGDLSITGWIVKTPVTSADSYFHNVICSQGPIGKKGILRLGGNEYPDSIMTQFTNTVFKGGNDNKDDPAEGGTSNYNLTFVRGLC